MAMCKAIRSEGNLIVSVKNCDTSHHDETLFDCTNATGEYTLDLKVCVSPFVAQLSMTLACWCLLITTRCCNISRVVIDIHTI